VEVSFALGATSLGSTLIQHDSMIYKYTEDATFWGDIKLKGSTAFTPVARIGYNVSPWLNIEAVGSVGFADYTSTADNRVRLSNETDSSPDTQEPSLGEFDLEARSLFTANMGVNASIYFLNLDGNGEGRWHPYATGGISNMWYSINSNYVDDPATAIDFNLGGGLRILADKNISIRIEALFHFNSVQFTPSDEFTSLNEGTISIPLDEFISQESGLVQKRITEFSSQSIGALGISIGMQGSF